MGKLINREKSCAENFKQNKEMNSHQISGEIELCYETNCLKCLELFESSRERSLSNTSSKRRYSRHWIAAKIAKMKCGLEIEKQGFGDRTRLADSRETHMWEGRLGLEDNRRGTKEEEGTVLRIVFTSIHKPLVYTNVNKNIFLE